MQIKELYLINFGKFTNKKIILDSKMTIIYGENEAGKSTIFHFIIGMFYGFYKPYVKNRKLLDIHETYNPWGGGGYSGSLLFYDDLSKRDLRIQRNFAQGQEAVKVFVEKTGQEITEDYSLHPVYRLPDIAAKHIGVSYTTFINTLAIKQLGHETDENLDKELKQTVVNALSTHNMDVSVSKVQDKINKELGAIGSSRRKSSLYYLKTQKIQALETELAKSTLIHHEILHSKDESKDLSKSKKLKLDKLNEIKLIEAFRELKDQEEEVGQARKISQSIRTLKDQQKELNISNEFSIQEVEKAIEDYSQLNFLKKQSQGLEGELEEVSIEIEQLVESLEQPQTMVNDEHLEKLTKDIYTSGILIDDSHGLIKELALINSRKESHIKDLEGLKIKKENLHKKQKLGFIIGSVSLALLIIALVILQNIFLIIGAIVGEIGLVLAIYLYLSGQQQLAKVKTDLKSKTTENEKEENRFRELKTLQLQKEAEASSVFSYYKVADMPNLISLKDKWLKEAMAEASTVKIYENQVGSLGKLKNKQGLLVQNKEDLQDKICIFENQLRPLMAYYQGNDIEDLKQVKNRLNQFLILSAAIDNEELRLKDLLKNQSLLAVEESFEGEELKLRQALDTLGIHDEWLLSQEALGLLQSKEELLEQIHEIDQQLAGIQSKSQALSRGHRRVSEIEEALVTEQTLLENLEFNKKVYEVIATTIETITDELQHNFAPLLNESVSAMVDTITDHKYQDVKINPQMFMRLKDPATYQMIKATQLSRGTLDLFYIALRQALATWVNGDKELPVIFDETFAHFDDLRLEAALRLFSNSKQQVLLFTCQKREVDIVTKYNLATVISL